MVGPLVDWSNQADFFPDVGGQLPGTYFFIVIKGDLMKIFNFKGLGQMAYKSLLHG
jgi:hypothetical protein